MHNAVVIINLKNDEKRKAKKRNVLLQARKPLQYFHCELVEMSIFKRGFV
jgi:hypothetical protein